MTTAAHPYSDANVFMVYGFETHGLTDPAEIAQRAATDNAIMKCPVLAKDLAMAGELFAEKYPDLMIGGVVNLAEIPKEVATMEEFLEDNIKQWEQAQQEDGAPSAASRLKALFRSV